MPNASSAIGTIATAKPYVGRFAPSPTGPLHFGSLVAAVASYLEARTRNGRWLVRIEDIDPPREQAGASARIIEGLERYGFEWDGDIVYQRRSHAAHDEAIQRLLDEGMAYPCGCSRKDLADAPRGPLGTIYPGTCRQGCSATETAIRVRTTDEPLTFQDALQGRFTHRLESESGDFVIRRRDGLVAYQLAVVVDDALQGVTEVVRGIDIIDSTARQIWLQRLLDYPVPAYVHIPVITHPDGDKLSKLTGAPAISLEDVRPTLVTALLALRQAPPNDLAAAALPDIWRWAMEHWKLEELQGLKAIRHDHIPGNCLTLTPHLK